MITNTGKNLNIIIDCDYNKQDNWMALSCFYSLSIYLPDSPITVMCSRKCYDEVFNWAYKMDLRLFLYKSYSGYITEYAEKSGVVDFPILVIKPHIVMIREISSDILNKMNSKNSFFGDNNLYFHSVKDMKIMETKKIYCDAKEFSGESFVSFYNGCGKFIRSRWIDNRGGPFDGATRMIELNSNLNERKILDQWKDISKFYSVL